MRTCVECGSPTRTRDGMCSTCKNELAVMKPTSPIRAVWNDETDPIPELNFDRRALTAQEVYNGEVFRDDI